MDDLTEPQRKILDEVSRRDSARLPAPTLRELMPVSGLNSSSVVLYNVRRLARLELVTYEPGTVRTMRPTRKGRRVLKQAAAA